MIFLKTWDIIIEAVDNIDYFDKFLINRRINPEIIKELEGNYKEMLWRAFHRYYNNQKLTDKQKKLIKLLKAFPKMRD